jgi:hypothetical protein
MKKDRTGRKERCAAGQVFLSTKGYLSRVLSKATQLPARRINPHPPSADHNGSTSCREQRDMDFDDLNDDVQIPRSG